jgi:hypothetical protein
MYLTPMPGTKATRQQDYSCDANAANLCPVFDIHKANSRATQSTLHQCDGSVGNCSNCEQGGRAAKSVSVGLFGPGGSIIETLKPFRVSVAFRASVASCGPSNKNCNAIQKARNCGGPDLNTLQDAHRV